jgi:nucleoside-diphosphate-sugar epimerase
MKNSKNIAILGCGWLGFPLAKTLLESNYIVNGSTTSDEKLLILAENNINSFLISLNENQVVGDIDAFLVNVNILIIDIPPKLRGIVKENFVTKIENLIPFIEKAGIEKVIFVSSTSVYSDENKIVTEEDILKPDSEAGKQLLQVENILLENKNFKTTILRFGGLIGNDRNPIKMLTGRENVENPYAVINFIHQEDCINIILRIIEINEFSNEVYNAVAPFHPTRIDYYNKKALEYNLIPPKFNHDKSSIGKIVSSEKLMTKLNYNFSRLDL